MNPHAHGVAKAIAKKMTGMGLRLADNYASYAAFEHDMAMIADAAIEAYLEATKKPEPLAGLLQATPNKDRDAMLDEASLKGWP